MMKPLPIPLSCCENERRKSTYNQATFNSFSQLNPKTYLTEANHIHDKSQVIQERNSRDIYFQVQLKKTKAEEKELYENKDEE